MKNSAFILNDWFKCADKAVYNADNNVYIAPDYKYKRTPKSDQTRKISWKFNSDVFTHVKESSRCYEPKT